MQTRREHALLRWLAASAAVLFPLVCLDRGIGYAFGTKWRHRAVRAAGDLAGLHREPVWHAQLRPSASPKGCQ